MEVFEQNGFVLAGSFWALALIYRLLPASWGLKRQSRDWFVTALNVLGVTLVLGVLRWMGWAS